MRKVSIVIDEKLEDFFYLSICDDMNNDIKDTIPDDSKSIRLELNNIFLQKKYGVLVSFLYWLLSFLAGSSDRGIFSIKPYIYFYDYKLNDTQSISINVNKKYEIMINDDGRSFKSSMFRRSSRKIIRRWICFLIIPLIIMTWINIMILGFAISSKIIFIALISVLGIALQMVFIIRKIRDFIIARKVLHND